MMAATRDGKGNTLSRRNADGSVRFEAFGRVDGKKKYLGSFPSKKAADQAREEHAVTQRKIQRGELPPALDQRRTFEDVAKEWITGSKRARSVKRYQSSLKLYIYPHLRNVSIVDITVKTLESAQRSMLDQPGISRRTVAHSMTMVASIVRHAWKRGYIATNPAAMLDIAEFGERTFQWIRTKAEIELLLNACSDPHRTMFAMMVMTGMRRTEACYLEWVDVDLEQRLICVQRGEYGMPKGKRFRYVPICDGLLLVLKRWRLMRGKATGLVFPGPTGGVRSHKAVSKMFKRRAAQAGIDKAVRLHDLRHTYASHFVRDGGDIFRLSKYLGHASVKITERIYAHLVPDDYSKDWGRVSIRVQFEDAKVIPIAGGQREDDLAAASIVDGSSR